MKEMATGEPPGLTTLPLAVSMEAPLTYISCGMHIPPRFWTMQSNDYRVAPGEAGTGSDQGANISAATNCDAVSSAVESGDFAAAGFARGLDFQSVETTATVCKARGRGVAEGGQC